MPWITTCFAIRGRPGHVSGYMYVPCELTTDRPRTVMRGGSQHTWYMTTCTASHALYSSRCFQVTRRHTHCDHRTPMSDGVRQSKTRSESHQAQNAQSPMISIPDVSANMSVKSRDVCSRSHPVKYCPAAPVTTAKTEVAPSVHGGVQTCGRGLSACTNRWCD